MRLCYNSFLRAAQVAPAQAPGDVTGYTMYAAMDAPPGTVTLDGDKIADVDAATCGAMCTAAADCDAFAYFAPGVKPFTCYLKDLR
jgi:hypothetical protein